MELARLINSKNENKENLSSGKKGDFKQQKTKTQDVNDNRTSQPKTLYFINTYGQKSYYEEEDFKKKHKRHKSLSWSEKNYDSPRKHKDRGPHHPYSTRVSYIKKNNLDHPVVDESFRNSRLYPQESVKDKDRNINNLATEINEMEIEEHRKKEGWKDKTSESIRSS